MWVMMIITEEKRKYIKNQCLAQTGIWARLEIIQPTQSTVYIIKGHLQTDLKCIIHVHQVTTGTELRTS